MTLSRLSRLSIIAAVAENGVIGRGNELPWRLPEDLKRFKRLTMGHHLVVGRKTFESIGRALPGRTLLVVTSGRPTLPDGCRRAASIDEALAVARRAGDDEVFVGGGGDVYRQTLGRADRLYLTRVHAAFEGDVRFPAFDAGSWRLVEREERPADERHAVRYTFETYDRERSGEDEAAEGR